ncbi:MAG: hypothetical protein RLO08_13155 [Parvibaculaceae bacterium]
MLVIRDEAELLEYERRNGLVAVYVDRGYDPKVASLILGIKDAFDANVGAAWHILIPLKNSRFPHGGYAPDAPIDPADYNIALARNIAKRHNVEPSDLPALIFEFVPKREYYLLKLGGMSTDRIRDLIAGIGEIAHREFGDGTRDLDEYRAAAHSKIIRYLYKEKAISYASNANAAILSVIAAVAGAKTIIS